jgi:1-acyl-sn-glycerol-3-phosphate acyltransferase
VVQVACKRSLVKRVGYTVIKFGFRVMAVAFFMFRCRGRQHIPAEGPVLVCSNHQSVMDPILVGICGGRRMNYLARKTLFRHPVFSALIGFVDAIPIDRDGMGLAGVKESLKRLKHGEMVVIFPEGTRTHDGEVGPLKPGFCALARRAKAALLPVAFDGAFQAWPRTSPWPRFCDLAITFGPPITSEEIAELSDEQLIEECHRRIVACHADARSRRWVS